MPNAAKFCPDCGAPLGENVRFCPDCGAKMDGGETPQPAVIQPPIPPMAPPPPQAAAQYGPPPPPQGTQYGPLPPGGVDTAAAGFPPVPPPKRGKAGLIVGILGGVVVVAGIVLLILFLTVFNGGGGGGTNEPTALADKYMDSMMKKDVDSYMDCFEKSFFSDSGDYSENMDPRDLVELGLQYVDFKFTGVQLKVQSQTADSAIVVTTAGKGSGFASLL